MRRKHRVLVSYKRNSETVGAFLLRVIPLIDWDSLTEIRDIVTAFSRGYAIA